MTTDALMHPDQLQPGHMVGPWKIVEWLGTGGSACVFKVERDGSPYAMKMALRPISDEEDSEGEAVAMRMGYEAAVLLTYFPHRNLVRVHAVDCWPHPRRGYLFIVTDLVEGEDWHAWRWKTNPDATRLTETFSEVVRTVGVLHVRGVYHRDLKAENILIRREDGRPFLIDFGNVRLPGTFVKTMGIPPAVFHLLPPELLAYLRGSAWREGVPFQGGVGADLYALGVLLYQGLTDHHPFDPKLPDKVLIAAISTVPPEAPHLLNPRAPRSLSDIAMKLLEKKPEDRYPDTEALLQALWQTGKERTSRAWRVPLLLSTENAPVEATPEARGKWLSRVQEAAPKAKEAAPKVEEAPPKVEEAPPQAEAQPQPEAREEAPPATRRTWRVGHLAVVSLLLLGFLFLASWLVCTSGSFPSHERTPGPASGR
jgi:serine/threonine-protein kinase